MKITPKNKLGEMLSGRAYRAPVSDRQNENYRSNISKITQNKVMIFEDMLEKLYSKRYK